jgi:hypothetical protein
VGLGVAWTNRAAVDELDRYNAPPPGPDVVHKAYSTFGGCCCGGPLLVVGLYLSLRSEPLYVGDQVS